MDARLHGCTTIIEMPHSGRRQGEIGDPYPIAVAPHGKQRRLRIIFLERTTRHHDATVLLPALGAELSFAAIPTDIGGHIAQSRQQTLERGRPTGHYSVVRAMG